MSSMAAGSRWIAYQGIGANGQSSPFLVSTDGSQDHEILTELPGERRHPDFSRDGKRLAFDQLDGSPPDQTYVANSDGSAPQLLAECTDTCMQHYEPAWSPDGRRIAVATTTVDKSEWVGLAVIDVDSQAVHQVVEHDIADGLDHFPRWSADGSRLVFWRARPKPDGTVQTAVFVVAVNGKELKRLTPWDMVAGDPDWSPDGSLIVFGTRPLQEFQQAGQSELYVVRPDGTGQRRLTKYGPAGPRATHPRWTPDGKAILYVHTTQTGSPRHIYEMTADGRQDAPLLTANEVYTHPVMHPRS
jgi:TolB protein